MPTVSIKSRTAYADSTISVFAGQTIGPIFLTEDQIRFYKRIIPNVKITEYPVDTQENEKVVVESSLPFIPEPKRVQPVVIDVSEPETLEAEVNEEKTEEGVNLIDNPDALKSSLPTKKTVELTVIEAVRFIESFEGTPEELSSFVVGDERVKVKNALKAKFPSLII